LEPLRCQETSSKAERPKTPTPPPLQPKKSSLVSPSKKILRIPATPHHPDVETFWDQEFIDDWNDEHSPKKQLFLPTVGGSPSKTLARPSKKALPSAAAIAKAAKKAFEQSKHELADKFLRELDTHITDGKISELSAATGGIRIDWTNKLNTTAGRANWKRETIKRKDGETGAVTSVRYKHHASIELAEKVIDDEGRLLNVIAHEFCHLANFMVSGVTTNPHGKEFKAWAAKVTRRFGGRGIEVTTKHSYDIDFKYVWECTTCGLEFKRHSKSIHPDRHRCGACKSELRQTKPVPRGKPGKESEYQKFMKEQMKLIKQENPSSPQKDIMKMVATRWSQKEKDTSSENKKLTSSSQSSGDGGTRPHKVEGVARALDQLALMDLA
jgi:predicted SprT family Zn-dependent metalloprotease